MFRKAQISLFQIISIVVILALIPVNPANAAGQTYRVSTDGLTDPGCGDSWENTCNLTYALNTLVSAGDEVWVKEGTYLPPVDLESGRGDSFYPKSGVALYGGFAGTETQREQRDFNDRVTVLSGDTGIPGDNSDNSVSVIYIYSTLANPNTATLDGFTITGGNANIDGIAYMGGGIYNHAGNPTLSNLIITDNYAYYLGGGMANQGGSPILTNVTFSNNSALGQGGGMASESGNPTLTNVTFTDNSTSSGGGGLAVIYWTDITLTEVVFSHNSAPRGGGMEFFEFYGNAALNNVTFDTNLATLQGGGISFNNFGSGFDSLTLTNATFSNNSSSDKGGALFISRSNSPNPILKNITFANNAAANGNTIYNSAPDFDNGSMTIQNSILWTDGTNTGAQIVNEGSAYVVISDSIVEGGYPGGTNILTDDPLLGVLGDNGGYTQTIPLLPGSPAIDAGNDTDCATTDQRGVARPQGAACDIGAYEAFSTLMVVPSGVTSGSCKTWAAACDLQYAIASAVAGQEIWVKAGTYTPGSLRTDSFQLKNGVAIYGGFAGTETAHNQRDFKANITILSGDIGIPGDNSDNSLSVVDITGTIALPNTATLDGFTITGGNADINNGIEVDMGGGIYIYYGDPILSNLIITDNSAGYYGGGLVNHKGNPTISNVTFSNNSTSGQGGGMKTFDGNPTLENVTFSGNTAGWGGGGLAVSWTSYITLTNIHFSHNFSVRGGGLEFFGFVAGASLNNVTFESNHATLRGGAMSVDGGETDFEYLTLTNVTFSNNSSDDLGGAIYNQIIYGKNPNPVLKNVTFAGNTASSGNSIFNSSSVFAYSFITIQNSILWSDGTNNGAQIVNEGTAYVVISDSIVEGGYPGGTNILTDDPLLGVLGDNGGYTQTIPLLPGSPAIDAGNDTDCATTDQRGVARPQGAACDIGAYEYDGETIPPSVVSVTRVNTSPTSAASVDFTVTFSEPVSGVDSADFALAKTGSITGYAITDVSPASGPADTYTVSVATGKYNGTLRLDLLNDGSIQDEAGNPLASGYTGGEAYTITKNYKTTLKSTGSQDGWVLESGEKTTKGGALNATATTLRLGDNAQKKQFRSILSFSTKGLPDKAVVTKVTLKVKKQGIVGGSNPVNLFQGFMVDIKKGLFGTSALQASDFQARASKSIGPFKPALVNGWYAINLTSAKTYVNKLSTGGGLTQIRLRFKLDDNNDAVANFLSLFSGNAAAASRPQLIIEYYVP